MKVQLVAMASESNSAAHLQILELQAALTETKGNLHSQTEKMDQLERSLVEMEALLHATRESAASELQSTREIALQEQIASASLLQAAKDASASELLSARDAAAVNLKTQMQVVLDSAYGDATLHAASLHESQVKISELEAKLKISMDEAAANAAALVQAQHDHVELTSTLQVISADLNASHGLNTSLTIAVTEMRDQAALAEQRIVESSAEVSRLSVALQAALLSSDEHLRTMEEAKTAMAFAQSRCTRAEAEAACALAAQVDLQCSLAAATGQISVLIATQRESANFAESKVQAFEHQATLLTQLESVVAIKTSEVASLQTQLKLWKAEYPLNKNQPIVNSSAGAREVLGALTSNGLESSASAGGAVEATPVVCIAGSHGMSAWALKMTALHHAELPVGEKALPSGFFC